MSNLKATQNIQIIKEYCKVRITGFLKNTVQQRDELVTLLDSWNSMEIKSDTATLWDFFHSFTRVFCDIFFQKESQASNSGALDFRPPKCHAV